MKQIVNPITFQLFTAAVVFITLVLSAQLRVSSAIAVSNREAKTETQFKTEAIHYQSGITAIGCIPSTNLDGPRDLKLAITIPDKNDTPDRMMAVGKEGLAAAKEVTAALNDITALTNRLSTDRAYATKLLDAVKKGDTTAVKSVLKETMTRSEFTVHDIKSDFHWEFTIHTSPTSGYRGCFSSDGSCEGHNVTLG